MERVIFSCMLGTLKTNVDGVFESEHAADHVYIQDVTVAGSGYMSD